MNIDYAYYNNIKHVLKSYKTLTVLLYSLDVERFFVNLWYPGGPMRGLAFGAGF